MCHIAEKWRKKKTKQNKESSPVYIQFLNFVPIKMNKHSSFHLVKADMVFLKYEKTLF